MLAENAVNKKRLERKMDVQDPGVSLGEEMEKKLQVVPLSEEQRKLEQYLAEESEWRIILGEMKSLGDNLVKERVYQIETLFRHYCSTSLFDGNIQVQFGSDGSIVR